MKKRLLWLLAIDKKFTQLRCVVGDDGYRKALDRVAWVMAVSGIDMEEALDRVIRDYVLGFGPGW